MISLKRCVCRFVVLFFLVLPLFFVFSFAAPIGPGESNVEVESNETYSAGTSDTGTLINISGGYLAKINITATIQNTRWKAFIGWVNGELVLNDASGDQIFDWTLATTSGKVYATRQSGTIGWAGVSCANNSIMETENSLLFHSSVTDNITATFNDTTHDSFSISGVDIAADSCPALNTYVDNSTQDDFFDEVVLDDGSNIVYASPLESSQGGYDGGSYDFQMIVPQNASADSANTPYYVYVEVT